MLPRVDGFEVCRQMRQMSNVPVIMLTARTDSNNHVRGLGAGADDYMTKPFDRKILLARAEAALRRLSNSYTGSSSSSYSDDYLTIDLARRQVLVYGQSAKLTTKEFQLLAHLLQNADRTVTFRQILERVWGWEYQDSVDYVHVYISRLRQKLELKPKDPRYFVTEHGAGYHFMTHN
jgi:two-component system KDP operon response regulator KdpE